MRWATIDAEREIERRKAVADADIPQCPACHALANHDVFDVTTFDDVIKFIVQVRQPLRCSARCYESNPDRYLKAVEAATP